MNIARSSTQLFVANVTSTVLSLAGFVFFARRLGAAGFGVVVLFQSLVNVITFVTDLGFGTAVQKRISEGEDAPTLFASALVAKIALFAVTAVVLLAVGDVVDGYVGLDVTLLLLVGIALNSLGSVMVNVLRGELRVGATAVLGATTSFFRVVVGGALVLAGFGPLGVIYGLLAGFAVKLLWGNYRRSTSVGRPSLAHIRSLFEFAKYDFFGGVGSYVFSWLDVLIIGVLLSQSAVGTYEVAWRVAGVTLILTTAVKTAVLPQVSEWHASGEVDRIEQLLNDILTPAVFLVVPAIAGVALLARPILRLVFGLEYVDGAAVLVVLTSMKLISAVHLVMVPCLLGIDRPDLNARATIVAVVINLVLNVGFILQFGIFGAAVATAVALAVNLAVTTRYLSRFVTIRVPYWNVGWFVVAALAMAVVVHSVRTVHAVNTVPRLVAVVTLGVVVYVGVVLLSRQLRAQIISGVHETLS